MKKKNIVKNIIIISIFTWIGILISCSNNNIITIDGKINYTVEYGSSFVVPKVSAGDLKDNDFSYEIKDSFGNIVNAVYRTFLPNVGNYTITYSAKGYKNLIINVKCKDTILPDIKILSYSLYALIGETVNIPTFIANDSSGIDSSNVVVTSPSNKIVNINGNQFVTSEIGPYSIKISAIDKNGNQSEKFITTKVTNSYLDTNLDADTIYSFNNDNYLDLARDVNNDFVIHRTIIDSGYPSINDELNDNKVLKIESESNWGDIYTQFELYSGFKASDGYKLYIRFSVNEKTDYVKLFNQNEYMVSAINRVEANKWYDMEIIPVDYGYNKEFAKFQLMYRDNGNTVLYIDKIWFKEYPFIDNDWSDDNLADFDENGYLNIVYQNLFCDPTTTRGYRVGGSNFEITEQVPAENGANTYSPGLGVTNKALKITTTYDYGGLTYMFPKVLELDDIVSINLNVYFDTNFRSIIFGFFDGYGNDGGNTIWYSEENSNPLGLRRKQWVEINIPVTRLQKFTTNNQISGMFMEVLANDSVNASLHHVIYIDKITTTIKTIEQAADDVIVNFSTNEYLSNVKNNSNFNTAEYSILPNGIYNSNNGILQIKSCYKSKSTVEGSGDGFWYIFNNSINLNSVNILNIKLALDIASDINFIKIQFMDASENIINMGSYDANYLGRGIWKNIAFDNLILKQKINDEFITGVIVTITCNTINENNKLYIDEFSIYNGLNDNNAPNIISANFAPITLIEGTNVNLNLLNLDIFDDKDPIPMWECINLIAPDTSDVEIDNMCFLAYLAGDYILLIRAKDHAGNVSDIESVTIKIIILPENDYNWYDFGSEASYNKVNSYIDINAGNWNNLTSDFYNIISDPNASDNYAMDLKLITNLSFTGIKFSFDGNKKVSDIYNIEIRYRIISTDNSNNWLRIKLNDNMSTDIEANRIQAFKAVPSCEYTTLTLTSESIEDIFGDTIKINSIGIALQTYNRNVEIYIDYIKINEVVLCTPELLCFNNEDSLQLLSFYSDEYKGWSSNISGNITDDIAALDNKALLVIIDATTSYSGIKINLGEIFFSNIDNIEISYRIKQFSDMGIWARIRLNDNTLAVKDDVNTQFGNQISYFNIVQTSEIYTVTTITAADISNNITLGREYGDNITLSSLTFDNTALGKSYTILIDYIKINLKIN